MTYEEFIKTQIRNRNNWTDDDPGSDKFSYTIQIGDWALTHSRGSSPHMTLEQVIEMTVRNFHNYYGRHREMPAIRGWLRSSMWKIFLERITPFWRDYLISQLGI